MHTVHVFCLLHVWTLNQLKRHDLNRCQEAVLGYKQISVASSLSTAVDRITLTTRRRVELYYPAGWRPETKCHCVIYYMLQANDMNRATIDGVEQISYQGGESAAVCFGCIDMLISKAPMEKSRGCSFGRKQSGVLPPLPNAAASPTALRSGSMWLKSNTFDRSWQVGVLTTEESPQRTAFFFLKTNKMRVV